MKVLNQTIKNSVTRLINSAHTQPAKWVSSRALTGITLGIAVLHFTPAQASSFSYEGLQLSYSQTALDDQGGLEGFDFNNLRIEGSYSLNPKVIIGGSFVSGSGDTRGFLQNGNVIAIDVDTTGPAAFGFYHDEIKPGTDYLIGGLFSMEEVEFTSGGQDIPELSDDDSSMALIGGLRHLLSPQVEVGARVAYDLDADDDEFSYEFNARYSYGNNLDLTASFSPDSTGDTITIGIKKYLDL